MGLRLLLRVSHRPQSSLAGLPSSSHWSVSWEESAPLSLRLWAERPRTTVEEMKEMTWRSLEGLVP